MNKSINIIVVEPSPLLSEGLAGILSKSSLKCQITFTCSLEEVEVACAMKRCELVIINPSYIQNNLKTFNAIKNHIANVKWIALIYAYYNPKFLSMFDGSITISDTPESVTATITKLLADENSLGQSSSQEILSEREIDVLKLLATGMANKEIADKLNISTNTVITHRKNISQKTGIKSVSGLTIYAVVQKFISIETLTE